MQHSGSKPKWVPSSKIPRGWRTWSVRRASWAVGHPSHTYLLLIYLWQSSHLRIWRSSFLMGQSSPWPSSRGNTEKYLAHAIAVLRLINKKWLDVLCRNLAKLLEKQSGTLADLHKSIGPKGLNSKEDQEVCRVEIKQTTETLKVAEKEHDKAAAKTFKLLSKFFSNDLQTQWDTNCHKMNKHDS